MAAEAERAEAAARAAVEAAVAAAEPQAELWQLEAELGLPVTEEVALIRRGKAGRPPGARNRRSESLAAQVERLFGSPVVRALALATMAVDELAASLGCTPLEALQEQRLWLSAALPYVASRMPLAVDVTDRRMVNLTIVAGQPAPEPVQVEVVSFQELSDEADDAL